MWFRKPVIYVADTVNPVRIPLNSALLNKNESLSGNGLYQSKSVKNAGMSLPQREKEITCIALLVKTKKKVQNKSGSAKSVGMSLPHRGKAITCIAPLVEPQEKRQNKPGSVKDAEMNFG